MRLEEWAANDLAAAMGERLAGGHVDVFDAAGELLARCLFSDPAFYSPEDGAVAALPFPPARGLRDGVPVAFEAFAGDGRRALTGSAGYRDDLPTPEMTFRTRKIIEGADVMVEDFVFSLIMDTAE